jgi:hypothetical protein
MTSRPALGITASLVPKPGALPLDQRSAVAGIHCRHDLEAGRLYRSSPPSAYCSFPRTDVPVLGRVCSLDRTEQCCGVCRPTSLFGRIGLMFAHLDDLPAVPARDGATSPLTPGGISGPIYGVQKFPVAGGRARAMLFRVGAEPARKAVALIGGALAEIAEIGAASSRRAAALTPRTCVHRLPGLCLSGPFRSELSARSADRGRVVPVLDRSSGRSPIAPFAPSFP